MKRWIVVVLLCVVLGVWFLETIQQDAGYVLISLNGWTLETSFWFSVFTILFALIVIVLVLLCIKRVIRVILKGSSWYSLHRSSVIEQHYRKGLLSFLTGDYKTANKQLSIVSKRNELPVVRVITTAQSLAKEGFIDKGVSLLEQAEEKYVDDKEWLYKAQINLFLDAERFEDAQRYIDKLSALSPSDLTATQFEFQKLIREKKWQGATHLLSNKKIKKIFSEDEVIDTYVQALKQLQTSPNVDAATVSDVWESIPKEQKKQESVLVPYAKLLYSNGQFSLLEELIAYTLDVKWVPELMDLYAKLESNSPSDQLKKAERWNKKYPGQMPLLLALGILSIKNQFWGKAKEYLEQANAIEEHSKTFYFLGVVSEKVNNTSEAFTYYKRASELLC